jgi:hypothetical protein
MADATGEAKEHLRVAFDRRLKLEFHGARITSDAGLLAYRELDDALGLTTIAVSALAEGRRRTNIRHRLHGLLRQAVYGRLAGYEDVNDAEGRAMRRTLAEPAGPSRAGPWNGQSPFRLLVIAPPAGLPVGGRSFQEHRRAKTWRLTRECPIKDTHF